MQAVIAQYAEMVDALSRHYAAPLAAYCRVKQISAAGLRMAQG